MCHNHCQEWQFLILPSIFKSSFGTCNFLDLKRLRMLWGFVNLISKCKSTGFVIRSVFLYIRYHREYHLKLSCNSPYPNQIKLELFPPPTAPLLCPLTTTRSENSYMSQHVYYPYEFHWHAQKVYTFVKFCCFVIDISRLDL